MSDTRTLLIGMAPSKRTQALAGDAVPEAFSGASGRRLARLAGLEHAELARRFRLVNLLDSYPGARARGDKFPMRIAVERAREFDFEDARRVVLVGRLTADAFSMPIEQPFLTWRRVDDRLFVVLPHPSGLNTWWNDAQNTDRARWLLRRLLVADMREHADAVA